MRSRPAKRARSAKRTKGRGLLGIGSSRRRRGEAPVEYRILLTATLCLIAFGAVMVFSASSTESLLQGSGDGAQYLKRTLIYVAAGLLLLRLMAWRGVGIVKTFTPLLLFGSVLLMIAVHVPGVGIEVNGSTRWIGAGPIQVQPSELAKLALILYAAYMLAARPSLTESLRSMVPVLLVAAVVLGITVTEDLGTTIVGALALAALLVAAGARIRDLSVLGAAMVFLMMLTIVAQPYRVERLTSFLDPAANAAEGGYQGIQASIALGSGGLFGVGLGESVQKASYLPEAHTDMIAAVIGEELGLFGITILLGLFTLLAYAGFRTAQRAKDRYHKLLAAGLTAVILSQATINLFAVLGLAPLTGVPLPFVSYGGTSLIALLGAVGLLLNIADGTAAAGPAVRERRGARLRLVEGGRSSGRGSAGRQSKSGRSGSGRAEGRDSRGRDRRSRGAGAGRRRRAAG